MNHQFLPTFSSLLRASIPRSVGSIISLPSTDFTILTEDLLVDHCWWGDEVSGSVKEVYKHLHNYPTNLRCTLSIEFSNPSESYYNTQLEVTVDKFGHTEVLWYNGESWGVELNGSILAITTFIHRYDHSLSSVASVFTNEDNE